MRWVAGASRVAVARACEGGTIAQEIGEGEVIRDADEAVEREQAVLKAKSAAST